MSTENFWYITQSFTGCSDYVMIGFHRSAISEVNIPTQTSGVEG